MNRSKSVKAKSDTARGPYSVYKHTTPNGKVYIGITSQNPERRWMNGNGYKGMFFYTAINKYGWNNIQHTVIRSGLSEESAKIAEKKLIKRYDSRNRAKGYNLSSGGDVSPMLQPEARKKSSASHTGRKASEETRRKMSAARKGVEHSEVWKSRISESLVFRWQDPEYRAKQSAVLQRRKVLCFTKENVFAAEYDSLASADKATGCDIRNIQACCAGRRKSCGGYIWRYKD